MKWLPEVAHTAGQGWSWGCDKDPRPQSSLKFNPFLALHFAERIPWVNLSKPQVAHL